MTGPDGLKLEPGARAAQPPPVPPVRRPGLWLIVLAACLGLLAIVDWGHPQSLLIGAGLGVAALVSALLAAWAVGRRRAGGAGGGEPGIGMDDSPEGFLVTATDGTFIHANPAFHRLLSFAADATPSRRVGSLDIVVRSLGGAGAEDLRRLVANVMEGGAGHAEFAVTGRLDGTQWRRMTAERGSDGKRVFWRVEDVTAVREIASIREAEERRLADLVDFLPVGVFSADADGVIRYANQTLARWLGQPPDRLVGTPFADYVVDTGEDGQLTLKDGEGRPFAAALEQSQKDAPVDGGGEDIAYTRSVVIRDMVWADPTSAPPPSDDPAPVDAAAGAPAAIGGGEPGVIAERLRWLFDEAPVGMVLLDLSGTITDCNRAFVKLLGRHREAVLGDAFVERIAREDRGDVAGALSKIVMGTARATHMEVRMPGAGASEFTISLYASRLGDAAGEVAGIVLYLVDATEQKNLEVQFAQSQKMHAVGQLAGGVAHDFNNLLTAMIGFCDLLLTRHGPEDPSFADIQQIRQNANRATNLVRQLLAFSRKQTLEPVRLDVTEALRDLANLLGRLIGEKVALEMAHGRELWAVKGDRSQFDQIVINLCVNARDAMPGGGEITIRTENATVDAPVQRGHDLMPAGAYVKIDIADTGTGIAKEHIEHIFEPFFSTKEAGAGTGLGLSTVYGIVHQTGGFVFVDSAPGEGTTFSIYLPRFDDEPVADAAAGTPAADGAQAGEPAPAPETAASEPDLTGQGTVLLVEDEDAVRMFGARALANKGYT
ncbi:MAG: PAS domain-containing protein, partial [Magnetovibrio sp.]|nr:PAS domain-containing protein [Magnetovibrio sp.]